jgi:hypothetical protein
VSAAEPPIPGELWARMRAFLAGGHTGSLTLNVGAGAVTSLEIREHIRLRAGSVATRDIPGTRNNGEAGGPGALVGPP